MLKRGSIMSDPETVVRKSLPMPSTSKADVTDNVLMKLRNRPEVINAGWSFPFVPTQKRKREHTQETSSESSSSQDESGSETSTDADEKEPDPSRIGNISWCECGTCASMPTEIESLCCFEEPRIHNNIPDTAFCITDHDDFNGKCLDPVNVAHYYRLINVKKRKNPKHSVYQRGLRKAAYRSFTAWMYGYLGGNNRKPIPSCVVNKIRESFPDPNGRYTGFLYPHDYFAECMALD
uniref:Uncharacterized LOC116408826 n=2 Tax=Xenopus tropicalis TaxID=8364 RepID=A0A803JMB7_XENTR